MSDQLNRQRIEAAAAWVAQQLTQRGYARIRLAPGDMTEYPIMIIAPGTVYVTAVGEVLADTYWVALCAGFGAGYPWAGQPVDAGYAADKWTARAEHASSAVHTGEVVARFLTAVGVALEAQ